MSTENEEASQGENNQKDYEILREDYPNYDLSFKVIVIGNSGIFKLYLNYLYIYRCWKILFINASHKKKI